MNQERHIRVSIDRQRLALVEHGKTIREYAISTSSRGTGFAEGSFRTPTGKFRIVERLGHDASANTIFKGRVEAGTWQPGVSYGHDLIMARILRLDGLDPENSNTLDRNIYIHGTNHKEQLGRPAGHGCVRMAPNDIIDLFRMVNEGMEVVIEPQTMPKGGLFFMDCDSTLSAIEGIDELARLRGGDVYERVAEMTRAAMEGEVDLESVFAERLELIRPDRGLCDEVAGMYVERKVAGVLQLAASLRRAGWTPVIVSGGFAPLIRPLAMELGVEHVEAVGIDFDESGSYSGYDVSHPAARAGGKCEIIREWCDAVMPKAAVMMGDGASDLETRECVDAFVCFSGVVKRPVVCAGADLVVSDMQNTNELFVMLDQLMRGEKIRNSKFDVDLISQDDQFESAMSSKKTATKTAKKEAPAKDTTKKSPVKGKRYTDGEKKEILDFISDYNAKNGRGGQTKASEKYGVTQITLANWLKGAGKKSKPAKAAQPAAKAAVAAPTPATVGPAPVVAKATGGDLSAKLNRLLALHTEVANAKATVTKLEREFESLKSSL